VPLAADATAQDDGTNAEELPAGADMLEMHPSPPPAQLVPSWMDEAPGSDAELERVGREAVDDAIGPPPDTVPEEGSPEIGQPADSDLGPTAAAEAALRAEPEVEPVVGEEASVPRRSWFSAIFRRDDDDARSDGEEAGLEIVAEQEPSDRPEAERLMWITPRTAGGPAEDSPSREPDAAEAEALVEPMAAQGAIEPEPTLFAAAAFEPSPAPEPAEPVLAEAAVEPLAPVVVETDAAPEATPAEAEPQADPDEDASHLRGYREALLWARAQPGGARERLFSSPAVGIRVALGAALVLIVAAAGILILTRPSPPSPTAAANPSTSHAAAAPTSTTSSTLPSPASSAPATSPGGQLTEVVTAGGGGSGWTVARIRFGSPGNGITRVVFDLDGTGPTPSARLGRGSDGAIYLTVTGLTISAATVSGTSPVGVITAISATGDGSTVKFTVTGSPGFSIGYLSAPNRLVLDFK
jgi:hypothetical protein